MKSEVEAPDSTLIQKDDDSYPSDTVVEQAGNQHALLKNPKSMDKKEEDISGDASEEVYLSPETTAETIMACLPETGIKLTAPSIIRHEIPSAEKGDMESTIPKEQEAEIMQTSLHECSSINMGDSIDNNSEVTDVEHVKNKTNAEVSQISSQLLKPYIEETAEYVNDEMENENFSKHILLPPVEEKSIEQPFPEESGEIGNIIEQLKAEDDSSMKTAEIQVENKHMALTEDQDCKSSQDLSYEKESDKMSPEDGRQVSEKILESRNVSCADEEAEPTESISYNNPNTTITALEGDNDKRVELQAEETGNGFVEENVDENSIPFSEKGESGMSTDSDKISSLNDNENTESIDTEANLDMMKEVEDKREIVVGETAFDDISEETIDESAMVSETQVDSLTLDGDKVTDEHGLIVDSRQNSPLSEEDQLRKLTDVSETAYVAEGENNLIGEVNESIRSPYKVAEKDSESNNAEIENEPDIVKHSEIVDPEIEETKSDQGEQNQENSIHHDAVEPAGETQTTFTNLEQSSPENDEEKIDGRMEETVFEMEQKNIENVELRSITDVISAEENLEDSTNSAVGENNVTSEASINKRDYQDENQSLSVTCVEPETEDEDTINKTNDSEKEVDLQYKEETQSTRDATVESFQPAITDEMEDHKNLENTNADPSQQQDEANTNNSNYNEYKEQEQIESVKFYSEDGSNTMEAEDQVYEEGSYSNKEESRTVEVYQSPDECSKAPEDSIHVIEAEENTDKQHEEQADTSPYGEHDSLLADQVNAIDAGMDSGKENETNTSGGHVPEDQTEREFCKYDEMDESDTTKGEQDELFNKMTSQNSSPDTDPLEHKLGAAMNDPTAIKPSEIVNENALAVEASKAAELEVGQQIQTNEDPEQENDTSADTEFQEMNTKPMEPSENTGTESDNIEIQTDVSCADEEAEPTESTSYDNPNMTNAALEVDNDKRVELQAEETGNSFEEENVETATREPYSSDQISSRDEYLVPVSEERESAISTNSDKISSLNDNENMEFIDIEANLEKMQEVENNREIVVGETAFVDSSGEIIDESDTVSKTQVDSLTLEIDKVTDEPGLIVDSRQDILLSEEDQLKNLTDGGEKTYESVGEKNSIGEESESIRSPDRDIEKDSESNNEEIQIDSKPGQPRVNEPDIVKHSERVDPEIEETKSDQEEQNQENSIHLDVVGPAGDAQSTLTNLEPTSPENDEVKIDERMEETVFEIEQKKIENVELRSIRDEENLEDSTNSAIGENDVACDASIDKSDDRDENQSMTVTCVPTVTEAEDTVHKTDDYSEKEVDLQYTEETQSTRDATVESFQRAITNEIEDNKNLENTKADPSQQHDEMNTNNSNYNENKEQEQNESVRFYSEDGSNTEEVENQVCEEGSSSIKEGIRTVEVCQSPDECSKAHEDSIHVTLVEETTEKQHEEEADTSCYGEHDSVVVDQVKAIDAGVDSQKENETNTSNSEGGHVLEDQTERDFCKYDKMDEPDSGKVKELMSQEFEQDKLVKILPLEHNLGAVNPAMSDPTASKPSEIVNDESLTVEGSKAAEPEAEQYIQTNEDPEQENDISADKGFQEMNTNPMKLSENTGTEADKIEVQNDVRDDEESVCDDTAKTGLVTDPKIDQEINADNPVKSRDEGTGESSETIQVVDIHERVSADCRVSPKEGMDLAKHEFIPEAADLTEVNNTENETINRRAEDLGSNNVEDLRGNENTNSEISVKSTILDEDPRVNTEVMSQDISVENRELVPQSAEITDESNTDTEAINSRSKDLGSDTVEDSGNENINLEISPKDISLNENPILNTEVVLQDMDIENQELTPDSTELREEINTENEAITSRAADLDANTIENHSGDDNINLEISQKVAKLDEDPSVNTEVIPQEMSVDNRELVLESAELAEENNTENEAINSTEVDLGSNTVEDLSGNEDTNSEISEKVINLDEDPRVNTENMPQDKSVENRELVPKSAELAGGDNSENEAISSKAEDLGSNTVEDLSGNKITNSEISKKVTSLDEDPRVSTEAVPQDMSVENCELVPKSAELTEENNTENEAINSKAEDLDSNTVEDSGVENTHFEISGTEISLNENPVVNKEVVLQVRDVENHELIPGITELIAENNTENEAVNSRGEDLGSNTIEDHTGYENTDSQIPQKEINSDEVPTVNTDIVRQDIEVENHRLIPGSTQLREENNTEKEEINITAAYLGSNTDQDLSGNENTNSEMSQKETNLEDPTEVMPRDMSVENHGFTSESTELREENNTEDEAVNSIPKAIGSNTVEDLSGNKSTESEISQKEINLDDEPIVETEVVLQDMSIENRALIQESAVSTEENSTETQAINSIAENLDSNTEEDSGNGNTNLEISQMEKSLNENPILNTDVVLEDTDVENHKLISESIELREKNSTENEANKCRAADLESNSVDDLSGNKNTNSEISQNLTNLDEENNTKVIPQVMDVENHQFIPESTDIKEENNTENEAINSRGEDLGSNTIEGLTEKENTNMEISQRGINLDKESTVNTMVPQDRDVGNHELIPETTELREEDNTESDAINSRAADLGSKTVEDLTGNEDRNSEISQKVTNLDEDPSVDTEVVPQDMSIENHGFITESTEPREENNTENGSNTVEELSGNNNTNLEISQKEINLDDDHIVKKAVLQDMNFENREFIPGSTELREVVNVENEATNSRAEDLGSTNDRDFTGKENKNLEISQKEISLNEDPIVGTEVVLQDMDVENHKYIPVSTELIEQNNPENEAINSKAEELGPKTAGDLGGNENTNSEISQMEINLDEDPKVKTEVLQTNEKIQVDEGPANTEKESTQESSQHTIAEERSIDQEKPIDTAPMHSEASGHNVGAEMHNQDNEDCRIDVSKVNNTEAVAEHDEHRNEALIDKISEEEVMCTNVSNSRNEMDTASSEVKNDETLLLAEQMTEPPPEKSQTNYDDQGPELGVCEQSIEGNEEDDELHSNKPKSNMEMIVNSNEESEHKDDREGILSDQKDPNHLPSQDHEIMRQPTVDQSGNGILTATVPSQYIEELESNHEKQEKSVSNVKNSCVNGHDIGEMIPDETVQTQGKQPVEPQENFLKPSSPSEATSSTQDNEDCSVTLQDLNKEKEEDPLPEKATQRELQVSSGFEISGDLPFIAAVEEVSKTEEYLVPDSLGAHDFLDNEKMEPRSCINSYSHEINSDTDQCQNNSQQTVKVSCVDDPSIRPISENYGHASKEVTENQDDTKSPELLIEPNNEEQTVEDIIDKTDHQAVNSEKTVKESIVEEKYESQETPAYNTSEEVAEDIEDENSVPIKDSYTRTSTDEVMVAEDEHHGNTQSERTGKTVDAATSAERQGAAGSVEIVERSSEPVRFKETKKVEDEIMQEKEETNADVKSHEPEFYNIDNDADRDEKTLSNTECNSKSEECSITISKDSKEISEEPNILVTSRSLEGKAVGETFQLHPSGERTENEVSPMEPEVDASELLGQTNVLTPDNMGVEKEKQQESAKGLEGCSALDPQQGNDRIWFTEMEVPGDVNSRDINSDNSEAKLKVDKIQSEDKLSNACDVHMDCQDAEKISSEIIATHICQEIETEDNLKQPSSEHQMQRLETGTVVTNANDKTFKEEVPRAESTENTFMSFDNPAEIICTPEEREFEHPSLEAEPKDLASEFQGFETSAEVKNDTGDSTLEMLNVKEVCHLNEKAETDQSSQLDFKTQPISGENLVNSCETTTDNHTKTESFEPAIELQSEKLATSEETGTDTQLQTVKNEIKGESIPSNFEIYEAVETDAAEEEEMHDIITTVSSKDGALVQPPLATTKPHDETKKPLLDEHSANNTVSVSQVSGINKTPSTLTNALEEKVSEQQPLEKVSNQDSNITQTVQVDKEEQLQRNYDEIPQSSQLQDLCSKDSVNMRTDKAVDTIEVISRGMNVEDFTKEGSESNTNEVPSLEPIQSLPTNKEEITAEKHDETEVKSMPQSTVSNNKKEEEWVVVTQNPQHDEKRAVDEPKTETGKEDAGDDLGEEDLELKPMISESSRDIELKTQNKKSHHILSGMGSKMKNSISKVKKAMACASPQFSPDDVIIKLNKSKKS